MKQQSSLNRRHRRAARRRGVALLLVLGCVVLLVTLIVGFLLTSQLNLRSSKLYANGSSVKTLADSVVSIVIGQVQQATSNGTTVAWASQPGMIRNYDNKGNEIAAYRLYSWDSPMNSGTYTPGNDANQLGSSPPSGTAWYNSPAVFVDLNQPVNDASGIMHYPIIDGNPTDLGHTAGDLTTSNYTNPAGNTVSTYAINGVTPGIEGFWVNLPNTTGGPAVNTGTTTTSNHNTNDIPMPVKWLYVLQDGTIVAPTASSTGTTVTISSATPSNPIVGRIAYWTDDETSKVNINTASEGVYWDTPRADTTFERTNLAKDQPAQNEFQRYPGHPATTCLSTVLGALYPVSHTGSTYTASQFMPYFALAPKLNVGSTTQATNLGSNAGTAAPVTGTNASQTGAGALAYKASDRLYASVDELAFQSDLPNGLGATLPGGTGVVSNASYVRTSNSNGVSSTIASDNSASSTVAPEFLEKARFFLTANSRAPDVNLFNQPRIGIWPESSSTGTTTRTALDSTIAFCGTIGGLPYYFQRQNSFSPTNDLPTSYTAGDTGLDRNRQLITYLQNVTNAPIPGFGSGSFVSKYTQNETNQILTEMFDYVRTQNLEDPNVTTQFATTPSFGNSYLSFTGYTDQCGKGQVVPIVDSTTNTRGFGRFPTITEASLVFIVVGWNDTSSGKPSTADPNYYNPPAPTGTTTPPPAINPSTSCPWGYYGGNTTGTLNIAPSACWSFAGGPANPGTLSTGTIAPGYMRVQAALILSMFDPSQGYPSDNGCYQISISGLDKWTWNGGLTMGFPAVSSSGTVALTNWPVSSSTVYGYDQEKWGGVIDYRTMINQMSPTSTKGTFKYYPFFSNSIDLPYTPTEGAMFTGPSYPTQANPTPIVFNSGAGGTGTITINMYVPTGTSWKAGTQLQSISLNFPGGTFPCPVYGGPVKDSSGTWDMGRFDSRFAADVNPWSPQTFLVVPGRDVVRSVRFNTDPRLIAGLQTVDASTPSSPNSSYFTSYNGSETSYLLHSMWSSIGMPIYGATLGQMVNGLTYSGTNTWTGNGGALNNFVDNGYCATQGAFQYNYNGGNPIPTTNLGDWDNGVGVASDGPYINKADEGDYQYYNSTLAASTVPYFDDWYANQTLSNAGQTFFSPNRLMPSAVMFGSLPTGVIRGLPWQTLLFNPNPAAANNHPGFGVGSSGTVGPNDTPPYSSPPDHLFLDLFSMPVVEPYPISEPLSTAGRVNMNYQIVPFTYIERNTGVRAVLKSERIGAIPDGDSTGSNAFKNISGTAVTYTAHNYRLPINLDATLQYFDNFFTNNNDIFRSASQICNISLVPSQDVDGTVISSSTFTPTAFWSTHRLTGDNMREKPYADIYPRLTTKSNTFTVHYYVQTLKQAIAPGSAASAWQTWREGTDLVTGEYRGSSIIERYIDPNDSRLTTTSNDFASKPPTSSNSYQGLALDQFYKFRVISSTQFAP